MAGFKHLCVQFYGVLVKIFLQRWRTPIASVVELILPMFFMILMSIPYWTSETTTVPAQQYSTGATTMWNISGIAGSILCWNMTPPANTVWPQCTDSALRCLTMVGNGHEVCGGIANMTQLEGVLYPSTWFLTGSYTVDDMDNFLGVMALSSEIARRDDPTFFGRSGRASSSHYGKLLISSSDPVIAAEFMDFCRWKSSMCGIVLYDQYFTTLADAKQYAEENAATVWAIIDLNDQTAVPNGDATDPLYFTISMNYTATAPTYRYAKSRSPFTRGLGDDDGSDGYVLYKTSGFLTLENFVEQFYMQKLVNDTGLPVVGPATWEAAPTVIPFSTLNLVWYNGLSDLLTLRGQGVVPMPTAERWNNAYLTQWAPFLPLIAVMASLFSLARVTGLITEEKPKGIRDAMLIMGLNPTCMFFGWYACSLIIDLVAALLATMILKIAILSFVHYGVLVVVYFSFCQQNTAVALFISTIFSNPRLACWCAAFVVFVCAIPYYTFPEDMTNLAKTLVGLVPCVSFGQCFGIMLDYSSFGYDFNWSIANDGTFCVGVAIAMMWASFTLFMLLAFYFDRVLPSSVGRGAHPLFFLMPLIRKCRKEKTVLLPMDGSAIRYTGESSSEQNSPSEPYATEAEALKEDPAASSGNDASGKAGNKLVEHYHDVVDPKSSSIAAAFYRLKKHYYIGGVPGFLYTYFTGFVRRGDRVVALDDVSFSMRQGEVSVLLGPNGAGKSTLMGIMTGMVNPSEGEVYINGCNAKYDLGGCREQIGYCPQSDVIWDNLTVREHLRFYARLKGTDSINVEDQATKAVEFVELQDKIDCKAGDLSGGQKRRLCVAVALVGDSRVLILDEPTAGMDMLGRKTVYDAINRARANRSVLLSTHLLDEADRIGDRVLLINDGKLVAEGAPMYLKSQMSVGYLVTCVLQGGMSAAEESSAAAKLVDFVREKGYSGHRSNQAGRHPEAVEAVPEGCQLLGVDRRGREITFRFPLTLLSASGSTLLMELQTNKDELHLRSTALSLTTLEDVFMTVTQNKPLMTAQEGEPMYGVEDQEQPVLSSVKEYPTEERYNSSSWLTMFCIHFRALFIKRCHDAKRDVKLFVFSVVIPVFFLLMALLINLVQAQKQPNIILDSSYYGASQVDYFSVPLIDPNGPLPGATNAFKLDETTPAAAFGTGFTPYWVEDPNTTYRDTPSVAGLFAPVSVNGSNIISIYEMTNLKTHADLRYVAISPVNRVYQSHIPTVAPIIMHNTSFPHSVPMSLSVLYNVARYQLWGTQAPQVYARNSPLGLGEFESDLISANKQVLVGIFVTLPFILIPSNMISFIVREKEAGARHLQWLSGASTIAYWVSNFVFDAACYICTMILTFILFIIFDRTEFVGQYTYGPAIVLFLVYGLSSIAMSYMLSFFFDSPFTAQTVVLLVNFVTGFLWVIMEDMLLSSALHFVEGVNYVLHFIPAVVFAEGTFILSGNQLANMMFPAREKSTLYTWLDISTGKFTGGIGTALCYMLCVMAGCIIILSLFEYFRLGRLVSTCLTSCCASNKDNDDGIDGDVELHESVQQEEERVNASETGPAEDRIAIQHLTKQYMGLNRPAVEDLSLGVHEGEVLALLGLNGAGKSTTINILAGLEMANAGKAFVNHTSISNPESRAFVGYCPQFDALLDHLNPIEQLWLYARLRGVREHLIEEEVTILINEMGLYPHRKKAAKALSGGNRRRLSLAISMVGRTTSVLLDEPTAGMDAVARSQTCEMVKRLTHNKSVILTTHLLDEAEALSDRAAFMVRGRLRCIGTPQELRMTYTDENVYLVGILFEHHVDLNECDGVEKTQEYLERLMRLGASEAPQKGREGEDKAPATGEKAPTDDEEVEYCQIVQQHSSSVSFMVRGSLFTLSAALSDLRNGNIEGVPPVSYVNVTQPTLEDVLIRAATQSAKKPEE